MSKSFPEETIFISDSLETIKYKIKRAFFSKEQGAPFFLEIFEFLNLEGLDILGHKSFSTLKLSAFSPLEIKEDLSQKLFILCKKYNL